jgi:hypothetical protein
MERINEMQVISNEELSNMRERLSQLEQANDNGLKQTKRATWSVKPDRKNIWNDITQSLS